ncbi:Rieske [2Fe-2S] iron-sulfur domain-containing protein [Thelonectria olida]|uniref:Rieske [2Fe-2S] iron-sulfur domain-containing protein n=1 Tax=Thelonectria olida TaxID=1576542 RepID=A0A9P9AM83_9HYPO|nr:Rieske [2Fe-2S] iron-sulfur domain-containing protein [Thelonectria olida]
MLSSVDLHPHAFFCAIIAFAASVTFSLWLLISGRIQFAPKINNATRPPTIATDDPAHNLLELPPGWWTDPNLFQLERRAIFSKAGPSPHIIWLCVSHRSRFASPGDYVSHELAGFRFFLILGKDNVVRAFHNVCRHRAFPVTEKASGSATVLGCKYHGWCYNTKGQLTKAPQFDQVEGFDKAENGLFEIHTKVDGYGFLHVNLSASKEAGDSEPGDGTTLGSPAGVNCNSEFLCSLEYKGKFNWKVAVKDGFQSSSGTLQAFAGSLSHGIFRVFGTRELTRTSQLNFFPLTTIHTETGSPFWYQVVCSPDSAKQTTLRCDVYLPKTIDSFQFEGKIKDGLESHIKSNIQDYEKTYARIIGLNSAPTSSYDNQAKIAHVVNGHLERERIEGREIKPATVQHCNTAAFALAEGICQAMECSNDNLAW